MLDWHRGLGCCVRLGFCRVLLVCFAASWGERAGSCQAFCVLKRSTARRSYFFFVFSVCLFFCFSLIEFFRFLAFLLLFSGRQRFFFRWNAPSVSRRSNRSTASAAVVAATAVALAGAVPLATALAAAVGSAIVLAAPDALAVCTAVVFLPQQKQCHHGRTVVSVFLLQ